ncbi:hypothetical protein ABEB36_011255 [Hypothenemus hampei]|uniref:DUF4817 domain-containing protein n=1 Tax=Hypothenemus hampei TaxID=57062 RepID=A0ABD1EIX9_HYPHA
MNNQELTDVLQVYFESLKNSHEAVRRYRERFPNREIPTHHKFRRLEENFAELNVWMHFQETPHTASREISQRCGTLQKTVLAILTKLKYIFYFPHKIQAKYK